MQCNVKQMNNLEVVYLIIQTDTLNTHTLVV